MKPLSAQTQDSQSLQALGRASVQIVHDLKNQINGLKLYATFLRKRLEKAERPIDELDTVNKLIGGLDRTASDLSMIVKFGQPVELRKQAGVDLYKLMSAIATRLSLTSSTSGPLAGLIVIDPKPVDLIGEFDSNALVEALEWITLGAIKSLAIRTPSEVLQIQLKDNVTGSRREGIIEWLGFDSRSHDPFQSFVGSDGIRMSTAAQVVAAHGGTAELQGTALIVRLPLTP